MLYLGETEMNDVEYSLFEYKGCAVFMVSHAPVGHLQGVKKCMDAMKEFPETLVCNEDGVVIDSNYSVSYDRLIGLYCGLTAKECTGVLSVADYLDQ